MRKTCRELFRRVINGRQCGGAACTMRCETVSSKNQQMKNGVVAAEMAAMAMATSRPRYRCSAGLHARARALTMPAIAVWRV